MLVGGAVQKAQRLLANYGVFRARLNNGMLDDRAKERTNAQHIQFFMAVILHSIS